MSFLNKVLDGVSQTDGTESKLTIDKISEVISEHYEFSIDLFHGSKDFKGNSVDLSHSGSVENRQNDAFGTGFNMTPHEPFAHTYAGSNGQIVTAELVLTSENTSNFMSPNAIPELIERAVLESPHAYGNFLDRSDVSAPYYDIDEGFYDCPETGKEIYCSINTYLSTFGGLREVFSNTGYRPSHDMDASNVVDDFIADVMSADNMYDALFQIENELYSGSGVRGQEAVLLANQLNEIKSDYGVHVGIGFDEGNMVFVVTEPDAIDIKEIKQLKPKGLSHKF